MDTSGMRKGSEDGSYCQSTASIRVLQFTYLECEMRVHVCSLLPLAKHWSFTGMLTWIVRTSSMCCLRLRMNSPTGFDWCVSTVGRLHAQYLPKAFRLWWILSLEGCSDTSFLPMHVGNFGSPSEITPENRFEWESMHEIPPVCLCSLLQEWAAVHWCSKSASFLRLETLAILSQDTHLHVHLDKWLFLRQLHWFPGVSTLRLLYAKTLYHVKLKQFGKRFAVHAHRNLRKGYPQKLLFWALE